MEVKVSGLDENMDAGSTQSQNLPMQVTTIKLKNDNYLKWSATIKFDIASCRRIVYINNRMRYPDEYDIS